MRKGSLIFIFLLLEANIILGQPSSHSKHWFWFDGNFQYSYLNNDFYVASLHNYNIFKTSAQVGVRVPEVGIEPFLFFHVIDDVSHQNWNKVDWHNHIVGGIGLRRRFSLSNSRTAKTGLRELWMEFFAEKHWIHFFPNESFFVGHRPKQDFKTGVKFQVIFATLPESAFHYFWFESGGGFYYAQNSFYLRERKRFYLIGLAGSVGPVWWFSDHYYFRPYAFLNLNYDLGNKAWNKLDWHNYFKYGVGLRFRLARFKFYQFQKINFVVSPYGELQWIRYVDKVMYIPSYRPTFDRQAGLQLVVSN